MNKSLFLSALLCFAAASALPASSICPSTSVTNSDCAFLITIGSTGTASVSDVPGASAFNTMQTFADGTTDPGNDGSLVGVINNYSKPLSALTLEGMGANYGIFDFTQNGICVYTSAGYCASAISGYEGPTTTFSNLMSKNFLTYGGTVNFNPNLAAGQSTYFSIEDNPADIIANGGLTVTGETFAQTSAVPEPSAFVLAGFGIALLFFRRRTLSFQRK